MHRVLFLLHVDHHTLVARQPFFSFPSSNAALLQKHTRPTQIDQQPSTSTTRTHASSPYSTRGDHSYSTCRHARQQVLALHVQRFRLASETSAHPHAKASASSSSPAQVQASETPAINCCRYPAINLTLILSIRAQPPSSI